MTARCSLAPALPAHPALPPPARSDRGMEVWFCCDRHACLACARSRCSPSHFPRLQGRRHDHGPSLDVQRRQGGGRRTTEKRTRDRQSSIMPWGRKYYFDRSRFDADLKRIQAFLRRPRISGRARHRLRRQAERQAGRGRHHRHDRGRRTGDALRPSTSWASTCIPPDHLAELTKAVPLKVGAPRDRQLVVDDARDGAQRAEGSRLPVREGRDRRETTAPTGSSRR